MAKRPSRHREQKARVVRASALKEYQSRSFCPDCGRTLPTHDIDCPRRPKRTNPTLFDAIRPGSRVSIVNRFGQVRSGRAVMRGPHGWVLNMGGRYGTPDIATPENVVKVSGGRRASNPETLRFRTEALARKWADALRRVGAKGLKLFKLNRGAAA